ncbi:MAG: radical protein [Chthonomonadaceae bacterium]|nr:radical protein [Chthonomonadaceae bacterium]
MLITKDQILRTLPADSRSAAFGPSTPRHPDVHLVETREGPHAFIVNGSQIYGMAAEAAESLQQAFDSGDSEAVDRLLVRFGVASAPLIDDRPVMSPPLRSLSLAIAQKCNLGCTYCYAQQGEFGGAAKAMSAETALQAVDLLLASAEPGERVNLAFLGGEPLANRQGVREATEYASRSAAAKGVDIRFSLTTNGTLLTPEDGDLFERYGFAVTISLDGIGETHDRQRPFKNGAPSYARIISRVEPLLAQQRRMQVSARVTVTPANLDLVGTLEGLLELGFHSVGFSPMLSSPTSAGEMDSAALEVMLAQMIACGQRFEGRVAAGVRYPFLNMVTALRELHAGTHRPYPCGAGAGYMGVSADGDLYACHRFVDDRQAAMGSVREAIQSERQNAWLAERHVHRQEPCRSCWARYLCGGGCHHEVIHRGRPACGYIRGWLHYCMQAYVHLRAQAPEYFTGG